MVEGHGDPTPLLQLHLNEADDGPIASQVHRRDDMVGLDSSIIAAPQIWKSSGHIDGFSDPMVDCKVSKMRYRADQLFYGKVRGRLAMSPAIDGASVPEFWAGHQRRRLQTGDDCAPSPDAVVRTAGGARGRRGRRVPLAHGERYHAGGGRQGQQPASQSINTALRRNETQHRLGECQGSPRVSRTLCCDTSRDALACPGRRRRTR